MLGAGDEVGRWRLAELIGAGATSEVWRALPRAEGGGPVAIKILRPAGAAAFADRFRSEAELLRRLEHPAIVRYLGSGFLPGHGVLYLVTELVPGQDLSARLLDGPMDESSARRLFRDLASAMRYAHARGVFHRDLKPANVMVRPDGTGCVVDFGVALRPDARMTGEGIAPGTVAYMPPEIFESGREPDPALADVYALGVMLYEALTGRLAFPAPVGLADAQAVIAVVQAKTAALELDPGADVPGDLRQMVQLATARRVDVRLASMERFAERLGVAPERADRRRLSKVATETVWTDGFVHEIDEAPLQPAAPEWGTPQPATLPPPPPPPPPRPPRAKTATPAASPAAPPAASPEIAPRRRAWLPIVLAAGAVSALALAVAVGAVAWLLSRPTTAAVAVSRPVSVELPAEVTLRWDGVVTPTASLQASPGAHTAVLARGPGCAEPPVAGTCCAVVSEEVTVPAGDGAWAWSPATLPEVPASSSDVRVRVSGAATAPVVVTVGGATAAQDGADWVAKGVAPGRHPWSVLAGACPADPACAATATCPPGCTAASGEVIVSCGVPAEVNAALVAAVEAPPVEPASTAPGATTPGKARPTKKPVTPAPAAEPVAEAPAPLQVRVSSSASVDKGSLDHAAVEAAVTGLVGTVRSCFQRFTGGEPSPVRTTTVAFKTDRSGAVDPSSVSVSASSGSSSLDGCATGAVKRMVVPGAKKPGAARATFRFEATR